MFFIVKNGIYNLLGVLRILQNFWPDERVMYSVCALLLGPNFGVRLMADKKFYLRLTVEKMHALVVFTENIYDQSALVAAKILLLLTVETQKLKYKLKSLKHKSLENKSTL